MMEWRRVCRGSDRSDECQAVGPAALSWRPRLVRRRTLIALAWILAIIEIAWETGSAHP